MKKNQLLRGGILLVLGLAGVLSMLASTFSTENLPPEVLAMYSEEALRYLMLVNPAILTILALVVGTLLLEKAALTVPLFDSMITGQPDGSLFLRQLAWGIPLGLLTGTFMYFFAAWFEHMLPVEFAQLATGYEPHVLTKLLYGGFTEEILLRFGMMTLLVWLAGLILRRQNVAVYWTGIVLAALLFGAGHLGVVFRSIDNPSPGMIFYVVTGNAVGGLVLGWLYWKKGLESSFIAHICMHLAMIFFLGILN